MALRHLWKIFSQIYAFFYSCLFYFVCLCLSSCQYYNYNLKIIIILWQILNKKQLAIQFREGNGNPLQYSCLENPVDRGAWWAAVYGITQSRTRLKRFSLHTCIEGENGNPLQYSCLENPRDRGAWWAAVYGVSQNRTQLKQLSSSSSSYPIIL